MLKTFLRTRRGGMIMMRTVNLVFCRTSPYQTRVYTNIVENVLEKVVR